MTEPGIAWHALTAQEVLDRLDSAPSGLQDSGAKERLARFGRNEIPDEGTLVALRIFIRQFASPLIYLLLVAGILALFLGDRIDALFIFGVLLVNAGVSTFQEWKADASARALRALTPPHARVRRDGVVREVAAGELVPGDIIELESGMRVTADIRLLDCVGLQIDEASLTGESLPIAKRCDDRIERQAVVGDRLNMAFAGTSVVAGRGSGIIAETGIHTQLGHIGRTLEEAARNALQTPLVRRIAVLARQIAIGTFGLIAILSLMLLLEGDPWREIILLAIALAVAAIPEGLPIAVTIALSAASRRMARHNVIVRALPAVEGLGACTLIATDKTGTLTANRLTVEAATMPDSKTIARNQWLSAHCPTALAALGEAAALCNEAKLTQSGSPVGDAVDIALLDFARESGVDLEAVSAASRLAVIPYEPELKFAAVEAHYAGRTKTIVKGAPETVIRMCQGDNVEMLAMAEHLAEAGYRVLLIAEGEADGGGKHIHEQLSSLKPLGFVGLTDPLRLGAAEAVEHCREAGIEVCMITGDHPATALSIARQLGMDVDEQRVLTGRELTELAEEPERLAQRLSDSRIFARIEPKQKLQIVRHFQASGHIVAVTGDGVNDGPALRAADIGVSMGLKGTDVARGASDLILSDDNFAAIVAGVEQGRITFSNIQKIVIFMLATGIAEVAIFIAALAANLPMPLTAVQLLWLNIVTNGVQDVTLGFGKGEGDELKHPPRAALASLLDREALIIIAPGALVMTLAAVWLLDRQLASGATLDEARNAVLLMVVLYQNVYLIGIRHLRTPFWRWRDNENRFLFVGLFVALCLQFGAMHSALGQTVLGVSPVSASLLAICISAALLTLAMIEASKWVAAQACDNRSVRPAP